ERGYFQRNLNPAQSPQFNITERERSKPTSDVSKESTWRHHLTRHAASGKSISAFCHEEGIVQSNFYAWRSRLDVTNVKPAPRLPKLPTSFIDLGAVKNSTKNTP
ncbi:IS66 family insertion sequence element accessory protein TnpA, partial [Undibacterium sp. Xuan67W]|uniref:IS66 family insertion sequence element accessory protein TnpA n=1 Tax=Undibacterium sp. Xuan67W TaxID=3413057 RepID=UPI003BF2DDD1